jgi:hypothetical protein
MSNEKSTVEDPPAGHVPALEAQTLTQERLEPDDWPQEPDDLPLRPRRRLLTPLPLALLAVLAISCGFIAGVLVEKTQATSSSASPGAGAAGRLAALTRGQGGAGASAGTAATGGRTGGAGVTVGQVSYIRGSTLFVTDTQGNTIKVNAPNGLPVSKTVKTSVHGIHPGETVIVTGSQNSSGVLSAESISIGGGGRGLGALLGGGSTGRGASSGGGEPALFGKGG